MLVHVGTVFLLIAASGLLKLVMFSWFNYCVDRSVIFTHLMLQKFAHSVHTMCLKVLNRFSYVLSTNKYLLYSSENMPRSRVMIFHSNLISNYSVALQTMHTMIQSCLSCHGLCMR